MLGSFGGYSMTYDYSVVVDGHTYKAGEEVPDLGSFIATSVSGNVRNYEGLSIDVLKLPNYDDLGTGSSAYCTDTGDFYKYEKTTKLWVKQ